MADLNFADFEITINCDWAVVWGIDDAAEGTQCHTILAMLPDPEDKLELDDTRAEGKTGQDIGWKEWPNVRVAVDERFDAVVFV